MKKVIIAILFVLLLTGCTSNNYKKISFDELTKKLDNKETFIILFNDDSKDSDILQKTLNNVLNNYDLKAYKINSNKISLEQKNELRPLISYEGLSIVFIKDGLDSSKLSHITDPLITEKNLENHLTNLNFIKK